MTKSHKSLGSEPALIRWCLIIIALLFIGLFLILPLISIFYEAFSKGVLAYWNAIRDPDTLAAIRLSLLLIVIVVPLNLIFGLSAAWAITKFDFYGKNVLTTFIDLPFAITPVIAGLVYILVFGLHGWFGPWLSSHNVKIIFAIPGIILATIFVTSPLIVRELMPLMQTGGIEEEEAAIVLGANGWQTFLRVTIPNIKWGLLYGLSLCTARAIGEFGAVSVVSGHIRGETNTIPLHIEILYNEYNFVSAFAVASLLAFLTLMTLFFKFVLGKKANQY